MEPFKVGDRFSSITEFLEKLDIYSKNTFTKYHVADCRRLECMQRKLNYNIRKELKYYEVNYACIRGGKKFRKKGKGLRDTSTFRNDCPVHVALRVQNRGEVLEVKSCNYEHNHKNSRDMYINLTHERILSHKEKEMAREYLDLGCNKKFLQQKLQKETGKHVTLKDLSNITQLKDKNMKRSLLSGVLFLKEKYNACVDILKNDEDSFQGMFFQTPRMKETMTSFPEFLAVNETYKLLEINVPVFIFLVEDSNCQSEVVGIGVLVNEDKPSMEWLIEAFKENNPSCFQTKCLMTNKDMTERSVFKEKLPHVKLLLCVFHSLRTFNREVSCNKMGITQSQRNACLEILQQLVHSKCNEKFEEHLKTLEAVAPKPVLEYYHKNWHPIRHEWHLGKEYHQSNFLNSTNNRVECINKHLESVVSKNSTFLDFLEKLFSVLSMLENEGNHQAIISLMKKPTTLYPIDSAEYQYMNLLTSASAKMVEKELNLSKGISLEKKRGGKFFINHPSEGELKITSHSCNCNFSLSMLLPCRHIFAVRKVLELPLYDENLCATRWKRQFYMDCRQQTEGVTLEPECSVSVAKPKSVAEKWRAAMVVAEKLVDAISMTNTTVFMQRLKSLKTLQSFWESDINVSFVPAAEPDESIEDLVSDSHENLDEPTEHFVSDSHENFDEPTEHFVSESCEHEKPEEPAVPPQVQTDGLPVTPLPLSLHDISTITMPKPVRRKRRPKGEGTTVIGVYKKRKTDTGESD